MRYGSRRKWKRSGSSPAALLMILTIYFMAISGSLELLNNRLTQGRLKEAERHIVTAQSATKRAAALTIGRRICPSPDTGPGSPPTSTGWVVGMEEMIRRSVGPSVRVEVSGAADLWITQVDPNQLENALLNLHQCARRHARGRTLTVETSNASIDKHDARVRDVPAGQYVTLCVKDTGIGMTPEVIARAFDPFTTNLRGRHRTRPFNDLWLRAAPAPSAYLFESGSRCATVCLYLPRHIGEAEAIEAQPDCRTWRTPSTGKLCW